MKHYRFPRTEIKLSGHNSDSKPATQVQLLRTGEFSDPRYGTLQITPEILQNMVVNFKSKVRGVDLAIDYAHQSDQVAAGWIQDLYLLNEGIELWATVKWTPAGEQRLAEKEFRYLSADFTFNYVDNETGKEFGPTLFGAGLTNRPVVKEMQPVVELTEKHKGDEEMDIKQLQADMKALADKVSALEGENKKLGEQLAAAAPAPAKKDEEKEAPAADAAKDADADPAADADSEKEMSAEDMKKKLKEMEAKCATYEEELAQLKAGKDKAEADKKMAERKASFAKLLAEGKAVAAQEKSFLDGDMEGFVKLSQASKLSSAGNGTTPTTITTDTVAAEVKKLAEEMVKAGKVKGLADGFKAVLAERKDLAEQYTKAYKVN